MIQKAIPAEGERLKPWHWRPDMQSDESRQALAALHERRGYSIDPHDPELLLCLDKVDIISRYQLLVQQRESERRQTAEFHESEMRRLKAAIGNAGQWWDHCIDLRRRKRKTANLADMTA